MRESSPLLSISPNAWARSRAAATSAIEPSEIRKNQLRRAIASVVLNIAEGNARRSATERRRFFEIARASAVEVSACIDLASSFGLMPPLQANAVKSGLTEVSKMLWALIR